MVLWGIALKARIDEALDKRDKRLFQESVRLYKQVRQSCFGNFELDSVSRVQWGN